jgi:hypothetical protein
LGNGQAGQSVERRKKRRKIKVESPNWRRVPDVSGLQGASSSFEWVIELHRG